MGECVALNKQSGNMYGFVTHTWNTIKGKCFHDCSYCYMKKFKLNPVRFDEKELKTDLGHDNFIFVGSGCDMWADNIPYEWIEKTLNHCFVNLSNTFLFQTKNPKNFMGHFFPKNSILCVTIESNRYYHEIMNNSPLIKNRVKDFISLPDTMFRKMITIEPVLDFDLYELVEIIQEINPFQVNIGADSKCHKLPEPDKIKIESLINELNKFTKVFLKDNLKRLYI